MNEAEKMGRHSGIHPVATRTKQTASGRPPALRARRSAALKVGATVGVGISSGIILLWLAINRLPSVGPWFADTARSILGPDAVSGIEEWAYDLDDRWNRWWRRGEKPTAHWTIRVPGAEPTVLPEDSRDAGVEVRGITPFAPADVGPLFEEVAAQGDGTWVPVVDLMHPRDSVVVFKTLIHPDQERPWAELFVAAIDLRQTTTFVAPGTIEPVAATDAGDLHVRSGLVPEQRRDELVAAFNGGFKAEHGHYGMMVDGVTLLPARPRACTIAGYADGALRIGTWTRLASTEIEMAWWRQAPACMVEGGKLHPGLAKEDARSWGTALGGETVVRRSAVGLDREHATLYVGVSNATHARAFALAMQHVGAADVAQLDINWSYPHVVMFRPSQEGAPEGYVLFEGFAYDNNTYVSRRSQRDFFYVTKTTRH